MPEFIPIQIAAQSIGVSAKTLKRWHQLGYGLRLVKQGPHSHSRLVVNASEFKAWYRSEFLRPLASRRRVAR